MNDASEDFRNFLIRKLKETKMTQGELAERLGQTQASISQYVNGRRKPPLEKIIEICEVLDAEARLVIKENNGIREND